MNNKVIRLSNLIKGIVAGGKTLTALHTDIAKVNEEAGTHCRVSRHILQVLADNPKSVNLSYESLVALDCYFSRLGEGLDKRPIFEQRGLLDCLSTKQKAAFLFAGKPDTKQHDDVSLWDTRSIAVLIQDIYRVVPDMRFELVEVMLKPKLSRTEVEGLSWYARLREDDRSLISIGSPRACLASEVMLANMFGVEPFECPTPTIGSVKTLPFYFLWPPRLCRDLHSHFVPRIAHIQATDKSLYQKILRKSLSAVQIEGRWYPVERGAKQWSMYGIIAAQRRSTNQVWMVISGISGPATYAAATLVKRIGAILPAVGDESSVLWVPVEVRVCRDPKKKIGEDRVIDYCAFLGKPRLWPTPPPAA